jgi:hypothetical protein
MEARAVHMPFPQSLTSDLVFFMKGRKKNLSLIGNDSHHFIGRSPSNNHNYQHSCDSKPLVSLCHDTRFASVCSTS